MQSKNINQILNEINCLQMWFSNRRRKNKDIWNFILLIKFQSLLVKL